jgi:hypothetical protein
MSVRRERLGKQSKSGPLWFLGRILALLSTVAPRSRPPTLRRLHVRQVRWPKVKEDALGTDNLDAVRADNPLAQAMTEIFQHGLQVFEVCWCSLRLLALWIAKGKFVAQPFDVVHPFGGLTTLATVAGNNSMAAA